MSIHFHYPVATDLLIVALSGSVSRAENATAYREIRAAAAFDGLRRLLTDLTALEMTEVSSADVRMLVTGFAAHALRRDAPLRIALCAEYETLGYAMSRMFQAYATDRDGIAEVDVIGPAEAMDWTELPQYHAALLAAQGTTVDIR